ncbi:MAG: R3H domain-containing nucleic acid-binding protein [Synechococcales bacterium]|nr:R3H domain-containing nucleic acid-binding protein [Synechococcales bacterium]
MGEGERGRIWLEKLLLLLGLPSTVEVDTSQLEAEGSCWLIIDADQLSQGQIQHLLGERGIVLDAIQYLANTTLNLDCPEDEQCAYTVELNGYRAQRQVELQAIADEAVQQVRASGEEFEIASLSAAERRQVHTFLKSFEDIETQSRGREPDRRLVVRLRQT